MHPPPEKPPLDRQIKRVAKQMLLNNMKPVQIEKELVLSTDPISARYLPTRRQLVNMNTYLRSRYLPSPNALNNIIAMYHDNFLIQLTLYPNFVIILGAPEAKQLFQFYGRTIFIDGTFDLCEEKVVLTTIMLSIGELGVPAFFIMLSCNAYSGNKNRTILMGRQSNSVQFSDRCPSSLCAEHHTRGEVVVLCVEGEGDSPREKRGRTPRMARKPARCRSAFRHRVATRSSPSWSKSWLIDVPIFSSHGENELANFWATSPPVNLPRPFLCR